MYSQSSISQCSVGLFPDSPVILHFNLFYLFRFVFFVVLAMAATLPMQAQVPDSAINPADSIQQPVNRSDSTPEKKPVKRPQPVVRPDTTGTVVADNSDLITDSSLPAASAPGAFSDSFSLRPLFPVIWEISNDQPFYIQVLKHHPFFDFTSKPVLIPVSRRKFSGGKELLFYVLTGLLLLFALLKHTFGKYFNDLFRVFFRTTLKQRQIREQLMQNPLSSLMFNMFFVASAGLYANFLLQYLQLTPVKNFWLLYLYCCLGLTVVYLGKFIGLKLAGWLFNVKKAADSYIFIVFIINKVIGIFLLPFLILLAFADDPVYTISMVLSWCGIAALLLYRFILGFAAIRNEVRFNLFHFFLYLCAFEITPLLLIYRLLLLVF